MGSPGSSTEDSSSPGSSPKQRPQVILSNNQKTLGELHVDHTGHYSNLIVQLQVTRSLSSEMTDSGLGQDAKNVNLSRQKLLKGNNS